MKRAIEIMFALILAGGVGFVMFGDRPLASISAALGPATSAPDTSTIVTPATQRTQRTQRTQGAAGRTEGGPPNAANGGGSGFGGRGQQGGGATIVTLAEVESIPFQYVYNAVGTLKAVARVTVQSDVSGRVTDILFAPGDTVAAGDALVQLERRQQELELQTALAQLAEQQAVLDRLLVLRIAGSSAVTQVQVQDAETNLQLAQVSVDRSQYQYDLRTITAPIDGTIGLSDVSIGSILGAGADIATVSQLDQIKVVFSLPESAALILTKGQSLDVILPSQTGQTLAANITAFGTEIDPVTRQIQVEAMVETGGVAFPHGTVAGVALAVEQETRVVVPSVSVVWDRGGASVFEVVDGIAQSVPVTIVHRVDDQVWLDADLTAGALVVLEGVQKLRSGQAVMTLAQTQTQVGTGGAARNGVNAGAQSDGLAQSATPLWDGAVAADPSGAGNASGDHALAEGQAGQGRPQRTGQGRPAGLDQGRPAGAGQGRPQGGQRPNTDLQQPITPDSAAGEVAVLDASAEPDATPEKGLEPVSTDGQTRPEPAGN